jgi:hypothetical protein
MGRPLLLEVLVLSNACVLRVEVSDDAGRPAHGHLHHGCEDKDWTCRHPSLRIRGFDRLAWVRLAEALAEHGFPTIPLGGWSFFSRSSTSPMRWSFHLEVAWIRQAPPGRFRPAR